MRSNHRRLCIRMARALGRDTVALASYPRSGNTWLARLIEALAGRPTGSIYQHDEAVRPALGVVIKTHRCDGMLYRRAIHLVRDPYGAIASYHDYLRELRGCTIAWEALVAREAPRWARHSAYWLAFEPAPLRVRYEDLRAQPAAVLAAVARFLSLPDRPAALHAALEAASLERLQGNSAHGARFFRGGVGDAAGERYTPALRACVEAHAGALRRALGYAGPPADPHQRTRAAARSAGA